MSILALYVLGSPRVELDGAPVAIDRRKALALLVYLTVTRQDHSRDSLATLLWPASDQSKARAGLRSALWSVTKALGEGLLEVDNYGGPNNHIFGQCFPKQLVFHSFCDKDKQDDIR